jgi:hypothetical protein
MPMRSIMGFVLLLAAVGGCTSPPVHPLDPGSLSTSRPPVDLKSFDPPTRFNTAAVGPLEVSTDADEVLLHGTTAVVPIHGSKPTAPSREEIRLVDTRTNTVREVIKPTHPLPKTGTVIALPTLTSVSGRPTVLAPFLGEAPGQGTTPGRPLVEVVSIDPQTGKTDWRTEIPVEGLTGTGRSSGVEVSFAGVADGVGVVRVVDPSPSARRGDTYALDLSSRKVLWSMRGFEARAVAAGVVAGQEPGTGRTPKVQVRGLDARSGQQRWASPRDAYLVDVFPAGPSKAVVQGRTDPGGKPYVEVVEIATGRAVTVTEDKPGTPDPHLSRCRYDEQAIAVCSGGDWVGALDAQTGSWLWSITKGGARLVPRVTGAWHGVVYGRTDNGPVVLDGRTGTDRETQPGVAPSVVNSSMAIGPWPGGGLGRAATWSSADGSSGQWASGHSAAGRRCRPVASATCSHVPGGADRAGHPLRRRGMAASRRAAVTHRPGRHAARLRQPHRSAAHHGGGVGERGAGAEASTGGVWAYDGRLYSVTAVQRERLRVVDLATGDGPQVLYSEPRSG